MSDLTITFTLTPAVVAVAAVFDAALIALGIAVYRRLRAPVRPALRG